MTYIELMQQRKLALIQGDNARAQKLLMQAEALATSGQVSDDEIKAAGYL